MIVEPTLLDHPKFLKLARRLGDGRALLLLLRIWGHCQAECRREFWSGADGEYVEAVGRWDGENGVAFEALKATGFIVQEEGGVRVHGWDEMNASMLTRWDNGARNRKNKRSQHRTPDRNTVPGQPNTRIDAVPVDRTPDRNTVPGPLRGDEMRGEDIPPTPSGGETEPQQPVNGSDTDHPGEESSESDEGDDAVRQAEAVWAIWPKRIDAMAALVAIRQAIQTDGLEAVLSGTRAIVETDARRGVSPPGRYLPKPTEFFGGRRYLDDPAQYGPRNHGSAASVPIGIRVRELADQLASQEAGSRDWWKLHREVQALRMELLESDSEPLAVRLREGAELLRLHVGNPENAMGGSLEGKRKAEDEFRALRAKWKSLRKLIRATPANDAAECREP